ncbi:molybdenum cofactor biosysynthesis protein [Streptomyces sp. NPDC059688]|uniref:Molybdenum cofactor biosysynthesis protein n=2 Tax=Streptomyces TaxID=1883 RepID=A0ABV1U8A6_9ACTN|nr:MULTISPECIES: molybdenum cofactor biosysynthesis protein [unclassified Streptomyces]OKJ80584.1 molybdenum cofactor biosysynthesis protein [Streptomyces sp. CB01883]UXY33874.1 molybdenum cofactor biosysynthesis protein [Streptomyces sp. HUAS 14-6]
MPHVEILQLLVSPVHRLAGRPGGGLPELPPGELVGTAEVRAGLGIVGDRYFNHPAHRNASITLMAAERIPQPGPHEADLLRTRRNVLLRGVDIDAYIGATVFLDCGSGPVDLAVRSAARPCAWMDTTVGPGAQRALRGGGGVRCRPLTDGVLAVGPAVFGVREPAPAPGTRRTSG